MFEPLSETDFMKVIRQAHKHKVSLLIFNHGAEIKTGGTILKLAETGSFIFSPHQMELIETILISKSPEVSISLLVNDVKYICKAKLEKTERDQIKIFEMQNAVRVQRRKAVRWQVQPFHQITAKINNNIFEVRDISDCGIAIDVNEQQLAEFTSGQVLSDFTASIGTFQIPVINVIVRNTGKRGNFFVVGIEYEIASEEDKEKFNAQLRDAVMIAI
jgi:c-di-GMP-binding flagellar brake protein YcgR